MKIWCLFSIDNNYDQPPNNLVSWFQTKPSVHRLAEIFKINFAQATEEQILLIAQVHQGKMVRYHDTDYWMEEVGEGKHINE